MLTKNDIGKIRNTIKEVALTKEDAKRFATKSDIKPIKEDISKIRRSLNDIIGFFDDEYIRLRKRVERIEQHLGISTSN